MINKFYHVRDSSSFCLLYWMLFSDIVGPVTHQAMQTNNPNYIYFDVFCMKYLFITALKPSYTIIVRDMNHLF